MDMVKKVARAQVAAVWLGRALVESDFKVARAAIEAMREPTEEMLDTGWEAPSNVDCAGPLSADMRAPWQAMIDAALEKG